MAWFLALPRPVYFLLGMQLLTWGGFFMVIPLINVQFVGNLGWTAASVGLALAARQVVQQGGALFGGILGDIFGFRRCVVAGLLVRAAGLAALGWAGSYGSLVLTLVIAALGGALFEAPRSALMAHLTPEESRQPTYALQGVLSNIGMGLGPLVGSLLIKSDFRVVALASAGVFALVALFAWAFLPNHRANGDSTRPERPAPYSRQDIRAAWQDRNFVGFNLRLIGFFVLWVQVNTSWYLLALQWGGPDRAGWIFALESLLAITVQFPLVALLRRWLSPRQMLVAGIALMSLSFLLVGLVHSFGALLGLVGLYSLGGLLCAPNRETLMASLANPQRLGTYFGLAGLALALGGGLGNLLGGWCYDWSRHAGSGWPWWMLGGVGMLSAALLASWRPRQAIQL